MAETLIAVAQQWKLIGAARQIPVSLVPIQQQSIGTYGLELLWAKLMNRTGGVQSMGLGVHLLDSLLTFGTWKDAAPATYTDQTPAAIEQTANDCTLTTLTNNDGHVVGASVPFNAISYDITTAEGGGGQVYEVAYWNGVAWTVIAAADLFTGAFVGFGALGEVVVVFPKFADWAKGGSGVNVPQGTYNVRVRATTAPGATAPLARRIHLCDLMLLQDNVADKTAIEYQCPGNRDGSLPLTRQGDALVAYFSAAATGKFGSTLEALVGLR